MSHFLLLTFHALLVAAFFAFLTRDRPAARWKVFWVVLAGMVGGALALAWLMFPYPVQGSP